MGFVSECRPVVNAFAADLGKCRSKRESTTSGSGNDRLSESGEGGRGREGRGEEGELGENFVYLERRKEKKGRREGGNRTNVDLLQYSSSKGMIEGMLFQALKKLPALNFHPLIKSRRYPGR